jgi:hypothetical protein
MGDKCFNEIIRLEEATGLLCTTTQAIFMKKKNQKNSFTGSPVKLNRNDLDELFCLLSSACEEVTISDGEHEYDGFDEVKQQRGNKINSLELTARSREHSAYLSIEFGQRLSPVYVYTSNASELVFYKVKDFLESRQNKTPRVLKWIVWAFLIVVLLLFIQATVLGPPAERLQRTFAMLTYGMVFLLIGSLANWFFYTARFNSIRLHLPHEEPTFWVRNKDKIVVALISSVFTALLTWLITRAA